MAMAYPQNDDPFSWDVDRVVQELCSSRRTWTPTPRMQFPDPTDLEAKLRDGEYDGELLLHSLTNESDLWSDLGITKGKFKQTIRTAIAQLRTQSPEYRKYEKSLRYEPDDDLPRKKENRFLSPGLTDSATPTSLPVDAPTPEHSPWEAPGKTSSTVIPSNLRLAVNGDIDTSTKPKKTKRRLDMTDLTSVDLPARHKAFDAAIPTEADRFTVSDQPSNLFDRLVSGPGAYWGEGKVTREELFGHDVTDVDDAREFGWVQSQRIGRAKARWVNGRMKEYLCGSPRFQAADSEELPLFGDSDEEDNPVWDLIDRENEEEREELYREKMRAQATSLHLDEINDSIEKMIQDLVVHWKETKLSVQQRTAYKIWTQAQQSGNRNQQIIQLTQSLRSESTRLQGKVQYLRDNSYSGRKELYSMKPTLEPTVFEIEKTKWKINLLQSSRAPDKFSKPSRPRLNKKPKVSADGGIDIWSEDELDDFIVDDDPPRRVRDDAAAAQIAEDKLPAISDPADDAKDIDADAMDVDVPESLNPGQSFGSNSDGDVHMLDMTENDDPIAFDTPVPSTPKPRAVTPLSSAHGDDQLPFSDPEAIAEKGTEYWRHKGDYKRLVVTLISNLSIQRRGRVLESALYSDSPEELWQDQVEVAIAFKSGARNSTSSSDKLRHDVAVSVTKFFDSFCGSPRPSGGDHVPGSWGNTLQSILEQKSRHFEEYWSFLRFLAPHYKIKPLDEEELLTKDAVIAEGEDLTPHQQATKAKLQKSARIRLHEAHSSKAKEARRLQFRATLQASGGTASHVINETKEAGQGLVYVHPHIAHRIRPHQLEGVRFLWDEITKETHKGCLLAHTMGLGKTMQTITLLCALAEAAISKDTTVSSQIPEHLKVMKVVILCPVNVLSNWVEELINWAAPNLLGNFYKLESSLKEWDRSHVVDKWATEPGGSVLVIGYSLLINLKENVRQRILDVCSIVVADEAHSFKNRMTKTGMAVNSFKTTSRIALTGSPLSNNVKEYYSMIDWVAPGFLGEPGEFNIRYGNPIELGFSTKGDQSDTRKAKILLAALKKLVETKVHRMSMHALKGDLPPKVEFIIYLDLSEIQLAAYRAYLQGDLRNRPNGKVQVNNVWALQAMMPLLLAHPSIYHNKLKRDLAELKQTTAEAQQPVAGTSTEAAGVQLGSIYDNKLKKDLAELKETTAEAQQPVAGTPTEAAGMQLGTPSEAEEVQLGTPTEAAGVQVRLPSGTVFDALKVFDEPHIYNAPTASYKMMVLDKILEESLQLGENVLVFSQKLPVLDYIEQHVLRKKNRVFYRIDGGVNPNTRQPKVHSFNKSRGAVFLISTTAGGVGLNMWSASRVIIMDSTFNPSHEQQAIGRAYRIGQTRPVFVYWLICDGTFERTMQGKQIFKTQLSSRVVDDKAPMIKSNHALEQWFKPPELVPHQDTSGFRGRDSVLDAVLGSDLIRGISSMETTETFEEEEDDKELEPEELKQANQMASGEISELSFPQFSKAMSQQEPAPLQTTGLEQSAVRLRNASALGNPDSTPRILGGDYILLGFNEADISADTLTQNPANFPPSIRPQLSLASRESPVLTYPVFQPPSSPWHESSLAQRQTPRTARELNAWHLQTGQVSTGYSLGMPQSAVTLQQSTQLRIGADPSAIDAASLNPNGATDGEAASPMSLPGQSLERAAEATALNKTKTTFKLALRAALGPLLITQGEDLLVKIEHAMIVGKLMGLAKRGVWLKLLDIVQNYGNVAEAMISSRISAPFLVTAERNQLLRALGVPMTQDPDHAREFLQRSKQKDNDTRSAADYAEMRNILRKRRERPIEQEKKRRESSRSSAGPGNSKLDPFVIDD